MNQLANNVWNSKQQCADNVEYMDDTLCSINNLLYEKYKSYALDIFRWKNLPEGIESKYIEQMLYDNGQAFFYKHPIYGFIILRNRDTRQPDIYNEYKYGILTSPNGSFCEEVKYDIGVRIFNNDIKSATEPHIAWYSKRMANLELSIQNNVAQQRYPYIIKCNKKNYKSMSNIYHNIKIGTPAIYVADGIEVNDMMVYPTQAPYVVDNLNMYRYELERQLLTFLGINNSYEKKDRLLVDEINSNNEFIERNLQIQLKCRKEAAEKINEMFGLNIEVVAVNKLIEDELYEKQLKLQAMMKPNEVEGEGDIDD